MFRNLGIGEIMLIVLVLVLLFGANKLPQLGKAVGDGIKEFKKGVKGDEEEKKK